ncbi:MAG: hypothetical protein M3Z25_00440 [Actinomycetota bacterium]|nr:hypothetical protein [Actinomycetota bacterium]
MDRTAEAPSETRRGGAGLRKLVNLLVIVVKVVGALLALFLIGNVLLTVFDADPANGITQFFASTSHGLALWFEGLFTPANPKIALAVNHGLAALFWLVASAVVARVLRAGR